MDQLQSEQIEISTRTKLTFGFGGLGKNLAFGLVTTYTLYYYNTVLGVNASFIGTLLMIARIFDAFNDPFMGIVVAKTKSKFGRYKPWILTGAILNAVVMYAMFSVPFFLVGNPLKAYIAVTYFLCGITYTISDIPFWSIIPAITRPGRTRESMTSFARILAGLGAGIPTVIVLFLVEFLGNGNDSESLRKGFSLVALLFSLIYVLTSILTVKTLPSTELSVEQKSPSVKKLLLMLIKNDQAISVSLIIVLFTTATYITTNLVLYIFQFDICHVEYYTPFTAVIAMVQVAGMFGYSILRKRFSNRSIFFIISAFGLTAYIIFSVMAFFGHYSVAKMIFPGICVSIANGVFYVMITIFISSAVDYGEKQSGTRENSMISSLQTLMSKLSSAFAVFFSGIGIDIAKINQAALVQTDKSAFVLRLLFAIPSFFLMLGSLLILLRRKEIGID